MDQQRRDFLPPPARSPARAALPGCATTGGAPAGKVVVVGGGYGGATAAKYLRMWSDGAVGVTLIEPRDELRLAARCRTSCIGGSRTIADITVPYDDSRAAGASTSCATPRPRSTSTSASSRRAGGTTFAYDRLVLSPGIDFIFDAIPSYRADPTRAVGIAPHAWKAGPQTVLLRQQLEAMPDGGVYAIVDPGRAVPLPAGPLRARVPGRVVLQAREAALEDPRARRQPRRHVEGGAVQEGVGRGVQGARRVPAEQRADRRRPRARGPRSSRPPTTCRADVLNVVPPQRAGAIARAAGVITANNRWCEVDFLIVRVGRGKSVHVLGDAIQIAPGHAEVRPHGEQPRARSRPRRSCACSPARRRTRRRC